MELQVILLFVIIGIAIYKMFGSSKTPNWRPLPPTSDPRRRQTGRGAPPQYNKDESRSSIIRQAQRQENAKNFDEASRLYLRGGQVFSAAKMKAMKGPQEAAAAIELIRVNAAGQLELITRNLVNEFFYRLNQPATAAAMLRSIGLHDEAEAVEVAANIAPVGSPTPPSASPSSAENVVAGIASSETIVQTEQADTALASEQLVGADEIQPVITVDGSDMGDVIASPLEKPVDVASKPKNIPNTMMLASTGLDEKCIVCHKIIKPGASFIYCLNCGKTGHYKHLAEIMKVTGKCPNCKERLVIHMYDFS